MHVLLTSPIIQSVETKRQLEEIGCRVSIEPVLDISPVQYSSEIYKNSKALIVTSLHASAEIAKIENIDKYMPIYAVGSATAKPLHEAGFHHIYEAGGNARSLLALIREHHQPAHGLITYLSGWHITQDLARTLAMEGYEAQRVVIYKANLINDISPLTKAEIQRQEIDCVILMSNRSAKQFCKMCHEAKIIKNLSRITVLTMSAQIAKHTEDIKWRNVLIAQQSSMQSIIETVVTLKKKIALTKFNRMKSLQNQD
jgi:uroporphyrinogen-III synthase